MKREGVQVLGSWAKHSLNMLPSWMKRQTIPFFSHVTGVRQSLAEAQQSNLASINLGQALDVKLSADVNPDRCLLTLIEGNNRIGLQQSLERHPSLLNRVIVDADSPIQAGGTVGHWCGWFGHWTLLTDWLQRGGDVNVTGTGRGWSRDKTVTQYASFLDSRGHQLYAFERNLQRAIKTVAEQVPPEPRPPPAQGGQLCCICLTEPSTHAFIPCGHQCVCNACGNTIMNGNRPQCPIDRKSPTQIVRIFSAGHE